MFMLHFTIHEWVSKVLEENEVKCVIYLSYKTKNLDDSNEIFNQYYLAKRLDTFIPTHFMKYEMCLELNIYENGLVLV